MGQCCQHESAITNRGGVFEDVLGLEDTFQVLGFSLEVQVLGLGLEACKSPKISCPRLEDSMKRKKQIKDNISDSMPILCFFSLFEK